MVDVQILTYFLRLGYFAIPFAYFSYFAISLALPGQCESRWRVAYVSPMNSFAGKSGRTARGRWLAPF